MTATNSTEPAKDGTGAAFNITFAAESVSGNKAQKTYIGEPVGETIITPAQDGTDGTGIAPPAGAAGIRGWLSGIFNKLNTSIGVTGTFWQATQPVSVASLPLPSGAAQQTGATVGLVAGSAVIGSATISDGIITTQKVTVSQFHNADNQSPGGTAFGLLTGGVAQLLNTGGNLDRQRETGMQNISARGIATGTAQLRSPIATTVTAGGAAGTTTVTLAVLKFTNSGAQAWIQSGSILTMEPGTANQEPVLVTAVNYGTLVATIFGGGAGNGFQFTHAAGSAVSSGAYNEAVDATTAEGSSGLGLSLSATTLFNQASNAGAGGWENERSASGEADGASGKGTAVAAEYEFNAGGPILASGLPSGFAFDRARSLQGKGLGSGAITASVVGNASIVFGSAAATNLIQQGQKIRLRGGAVKESVLATAAWVPGSSATVPLQSPVVNAAQTMAEWDIYAPSGPSLAGFLADGVGIEEEALYDPVTDLYYIERAATQDAIPAQNVVAESPTLWNGATMDRWRGDTTNGGFVNVKASVLPTGAATSAKQPALGTAGAASADVISVQGIASGTPIPISGTISATISGFAPGGTYAQLAASTTTANVALPAGTVVVVYNPGTVPAYVKLGVGVGTTASLTASDLVPAGGAVALTVGSNTFLAAIMPSSTATLTLSGGAGIFTGFATGASGGGGGGPTTAASGAFVDGSIVTIGTEADAAWSGAGSSTLVAALKAIYAKVAGIIGVSQSGTWTVQPGNTANTTAWKVDASATTQPVSLASLPALPAGANAIGSIIGRTTMTTVAPIVTSNGVYAAGNEIGGLMTFPIGGAGSGTLMSIRVTSKSVLATALKAYIFWANPSNTTWTDKSAPAINTADIASLLAVIPLNNADSGLGTHTLWELSALGAQFIAANLYVVLIVVSAATLTSASTSDITVQLGISDD